MEDRMIPDERDQIECPERPDLRCSEHNSICAVAHSLHQRLVALEEQVRRIAADAAGGE